MAEKNLNSDETHKNTYAAKTFSVMRNLVMIAQLGLNIAVPLLICILGANFLHVKFGVGSWIVVIGIILGIVLAFMQFAYFIKDALKQTKDKDGGNQSVE